MFKSVKDSASTTWKTTSRTTNTTESYKLLEEKRCALNVKSQNDVRIPRHGVKGGTRFGRRSFFHVKVNEELI